MVDAPCACLGLVAGIALFRSASDRVSESIPTILPTELPTDLPTGLPTDLPTALHGLVGAFAALLKPVEANAAGLEQWIHAARTADLPHVHSFIRGIEQDRDAVVAALTTPRHNGRTEGVNTRTKMLKRQMYGRAGFTLLRHRILLA